MYSEKTLYQRHFYLLTPWCRVVLEKLTGFAASQEIRRNQRHFYHHKYLVNCPGSELVPPMVTYRCKCLCFCGGCYIVCYNEMETLCWEGTLS
jgi:hypothetical protein